MRKMSMNPNGMLGMIAAVNELPGGRYSCTTSVTTPMASEMSTAPASERRRAATTAAKAAAISVAIPTGVRPLVGATRMPASPASMVLTAQTPTATRPGLVPDSEVIDSESTLARTYSPTRVNLRRSVPARTTKSTKP